MRTFDQILEETEKRVERGSQKPVKDPARVKAWDRGKAARDAGKAVSSNPYPMGSKFFGDWQNGWWTSLE